MRVLVCTAQNRILKLILSEFTVGCRFLIVATTYTAISIVRSCPTGSDFPGSATEHYNPLSSSVKSVCDKPFLNFWTTPAYHFAATRSSARPEVTVFPSSPLQNYPQISTAKKYSGPKRPIGADLTNSNMPSGEQVCASNGKNTNEEKEVCSGLPAHMTVHAAHISDIHDVPMRVLIRPIPSVLDEKKVASLMETIQVSHWHCCYYLVINVYRTKTAAMYIRKQLFNVLFSSV